MSSGSSVPATIIDASSKFVLPIGTVIVCFTLTATVMNDRGTQLQRISVLEQLAVIQKNTNDRYDAALTDLRKNVNETSSRLSVEITQLRQDSVTSRLVTEQLLEMLRELKRDYRAQRG